MANLSKSKYITYCQCPKALWLKQYKSEEMVIDPFRAGILLYACHERFVLHQEGVPRIVPR